MGGIELNSKTLEVLSDPEIRELLKKALKVQEEQMKKYGYNKIEDYLGFEWYHIEASSHTLNKLVRAGILEIGYKSNRATHYRIPNPAKLMQLLEEVESGEITVEPAHQEIPEDLFKIIVGHEDVKELLWRSLTSKNTIHILLYGSPASAKSLFLEELARLPNSRFCLGSSLSKAGLIQVLFEQKPRYLILDELDKISDEDNISALLSLMERGIVVETKYKRQRQITLTTTVYAACNRPENLPPELKSRFLMLKFRDYTPDEFMEVVKTVLTEREKTPLPIALYIGEKVLKDLASRDPRDAVKIARLIKEPTKEEVDKIILIVSRRR